MKYRHRSCLTRFGNIPVARSLAITDLCEAMDTWLQHEEDEVRAYVEYLSIAGHITTHDPLMNEEPVRSYPFEQAAALLSTLEANAGKTHVLIMDSDYPGLEEGFRIALPHGFESVTLRAMSRSSLSMPLPHLGREICQLYWVIVRTFIRDARPLLTIPDAPVSLHNLQYLSLKD